MSPKVWASLFGLRPWVSLAKASHLNSHSLIGQFGHVRHSSNIFQELHRKPVFEGLMFLCAKHLPTRAIECFDCNRSRLSCVPGWEKFLRPQHGRSGSGFSRHCQRRLPATGVHLVETLYLHCQELLPAKYAFVLHTKTLGFCLQSGVKVAGVSIQLSCVFSSQQK